jgi:hypothetical protein
MWQNRHRRTKTLSVALAPAGPTVTPKIALTAAERIARKWALRRSDLPTLLGRKPRTVRAWYEHAPAALDADVVERIGHLLAIYNGLHVVFGDEEFADAWIHKPNAAFGGDPPSAALLSGSFTALVRLRNYVDAAARA